MNQPESALARQVAEAIRAALPGARVTVHDPDGAHLSATVVAPQFAGKTPLQQHRMVYKALGDAFAERLHALQLTTRPA